MKIWVLLENCCNFNRKAIAGEWWMHNVIRSINCAMAVKAVGEQRPGVILVENASFLVG
jgi:hypothetical protein